MLFNVHLIITSNGRFFSSRWYKKLENEVAAVKKEKKELENEVELLNDDDYVTRYARENYVFTRDGEQVVILPDIDQEK